MKQWEYLIMDYHDNPASTDFLYIGEGLDLMGLRGWEVAHIEKSKTRSWMVIYKREVAR